MSKKCINKLYDPQPTVILTDQQPVGFKEWIKGITYDKYRIILPNGIIVDGRTWLDNQKRFDSGSYTNFLLNVYKGL